MSELIHIATPSEEARSLELAMRSILRMFADGNLVYRRRETVVHGARIQAAAAAVRRLRCA